MDYRRKQRWARYRSFKCKDYLRNDFSYECAYCKLSEKDIATIGSKFFVVDHFIPQASKFDHPADIHQYDNLIYSCQECNSKKGAICEDSFPNPCSHDIFGGDNPLIQGGYDSNSFYMYTSNFPEGNRYIEILQLNSMYHLNLRKMQTIRKSNVRKLDELIDIILEKFKTLDINDDISELCVQLDVLRAKRQTELNDIRLASHFEDVISLLSSKDIKHSLVFEPYNMDFKLKINGKTYYCELLVDKTNFSEKTKSIEITKLSTWKSQISGSFGILIYQSCLKQLYFVPLCEYIDDASINDNAQKFNFKVTSSNLL